MITFILLYEYRISVIFPSSVPLIQEAKVMSSNDFPPLGLWKFLMHSFLCPLGNSTLRCLGMRFEYFEERRQE